MVVSWSRVWALQINGLRVLSLICLMLFCHGSPARSQDLKVAVAFSDDFQVDYLDHTVLKTLSTSGNPEYFLLFTRLHQQSRGLGKATGFSFLTKIYQIADNERFIPITDETEAQRILSQGAYVHNLDWQSASVTVRECDFLSARLSPFQQEPNKQQSWYFLRLSNHTFQTAWSASLPCANLGGSLKVSSNVSARVPITYRIDSMTLLVASDYPIATFINESSKRCFTVSHEKPRGQRETALYVFGNEPLPTILNSELSTQDKVRKFLWDLSSGFDQVWGQLSSGCEEAIDNTTSTFEHLDNLRAYIKSE
jgi:hypothetical protein